MKKDLALIWMSAGNSYFTEEKIKKLLEFASKNFEKIIIFSPDKPAEHNFRALGYEEKKVKKKAKLNANLLMNRAKRILEKRKDKNKFKLESWTNIEENKNYKKELEKVKNIYEKDDILKKIIQKTSIKVLKKDQKEINIEEAVLYLLEELAFIISSPKIYSTKSATYLYHKKFDILEKFVKKQSKNNIFFGLTGIN